MNRFYTLMIIPERSAKVKRLKIPNWLIHSGVVILFFGIVLTVMMSLDYWYVLRQLGENKQLQVENRQLRQQVQIFENQLGSIQDTIERVEIFSNRLRVITNIRDRHKPGTPSLNATPVEPSESSFNDPKKKTSIFGSLTPNN